jgi:hypothetical protein
MPPFQLDAEERHTPNDPFFTPDISISSIKIALRQMKPAFWLCLSIALASAIPASASTVDLTTLTPIYNNGSTWIAGVPPGWTNLQAPNLLSISNNSTLGDGPHNDLLLGNANSVVATVEITTSLATPFTGTFGGFFIDTGNGFFGIGIGDSGLAEQYGFNGSTPIYQLLSGYTDGPLFLELVRSGDSFSAEYSTNGSNYSLLYQQSGLTGGSQLDLTSYGGIAGETINFTNLDAAASNVSSVPEPAPLGLLSLGLAGLAGMIQYKRMA